MATSRANPARAALDLGFEALYRELRTDVYRAALRKLGNAQDAEDVTQAAFADAYRAVLRGARPQSPRAWLLAISENVRRRRFRTAQRRPREEALDDADFPLAAELPYEQSRALTEALATLPPEQRRIFVLREVVGLSYAEIAEELDSTVGSVQMLLFRARRSLRDLLDPPTVAIRRPVLLPPLPGWIAGAWSRIEIAALTPRAAASLGAAVLTVGGASVAVPVSQADGIRRPPATATAATPPAVTAAKPAAARLVARTAAREVTPTAVAGAAVRVRPQSRPAPGPQPVATATPAPVPVAAAASEPAPAADAPQAVPSLPDVVVTPVTPVTPVTSVVTLPVELPAPPVPVTVPLPLPAPAALPVTPPPLPPAVQAATGAAGAAGASAPPVPVPLPPLPVPPPLP